jgi:4-amino-4-deoxy-L-arabinose transferase-like glycosyltransferase
LWGVKGYGISYEKTILAAGEFGLTGIAFPLNIPLQISTFHIFNQDLLPGSKALFPVFFGLLLIAVYRFLCRQGTNRLFASFWVFLIAVTPIYFEQATIAYTNLPFLLYLFLGLVFMVEGFQENASRVLWISGIFMASAIWTRPEGILFVSVLIVGFLLTSVRRGQWRSFPLASATLPLAVLLIPWLLFLNLHYTGAEEYELSGVALTSIVGGDIRWEALYIIIRFLGGQILRYRDFGFVLGLSLVILILGWRPKWVKESLMIEVMSISAFSTALLTFMIHYVFAYSPQGIEYVGIMLGRAFPRVFLPTALFLILIAANTLWIQIKNPSKPG